MISIHTIFSLLTKIPYIIYYCYLPEGDDDDEVTVIIVVSLECGGDNNNKTG